MNNLQYRQQSLHLDGCSLAELAGHYGTPLYVYSRQALEAAFQAFAKPLHGRKHLICYAVKANSNLAVLNLLARQGAGFDIVSGGELARVLAAGGDPAKVVFSGVGKTEAEMAQALEAGIHCFNLESLAEIDRLDAVAARLGKVAPVAVRVNPDIDAGTHPYIATGLKENKFGIDIDAAPEAFRRAQAKANLKVVGLGCHIGSQLTQTAPFLAALERLKALREQLQAEGIDIEHLDLGGGLGVTYTNEAPPSPAQYLAELLPHFPAELTLMLEPGRAIAANAGVLLTEVEFIKDNGHKRFAICDAGMNDLLRPSLYQAVMPVWPLAEGKQGGPATELVGPVCETGDWLARDVPLACDSGDLLAIGGAGAYGFTMSSNYNSRPRPAEVMVDGSAHQQIRARESLADLWRTETLLP
ncbi:diaminopimelate decarboxylase [Gallaecimonas sp. GXIMD4217]|uniref:diaminopimelate decarboxylase n=1 Tax=Gallaecimonas sp. GXIMD4217 TaxID=3131927 RepID=UPI00311ADBF3